MKMLFKYKNKEPFCVDVPDVSLDGGHPPVELVLHPGLDQAEVHGVLHVHHVLGVGRQVHRVVEGLGDGQAHDRLQGLQDAGRLKTVGKWCT